MGIERFQKRDQEISNTKFKRKFGCPTWENSERTAFFHAVVSAFDRLLRSTLSGVRSGQHIRSAGGNSRLFVEFLRNGKLGL